MRQYSRGWWVPCLLLAAWTSGVVAQTDSGAFGTNTKVPFSLQGDVYLVPQGTSKLPDFKSLKPVGTIYATELNIPYRNWREGFPGVTTHSEWFAIDYHGTFAVSQAGRYTFRLTSDDGARLFVDDKLLIDEDGIHEPKAVDGTVDLSRGVHTLRLPYFQGPGFLALVLEIAPEHGRFHPFSTKEMGAAKVTSEGGRINISIGDAILFDFNKFNLKPDASAVLAEVKSSVIDAHRTGTIVIAGHTDNVGRDAYNMTLSNERAESVAAWLEQAGVPRARMVVKGFGKTKPKVPNTSDANRAQNRRVEISVQP